MINFKKSLAILGLASCTLLGCTADVTDTKSVADNSKPNIVLFFVDDLGWTSRSSKNASFETPNIEALASEGVEFSRMYIATPTCSPSRATLVTGLHPARLKMVRHIPHKVKYGFNKYGRTDQRWHLWEKDPAKVPSVNWLDTEYVTYAEAMKPQGYYNMFLGKWHLGHEGYHPVDNGFDKQAGTTNWGHPPSYYPPYFKNTEVYKDVKDTYLTDKLTEDAVDFVNNYKQDKPFMMSMWYYAVHSPLQGRKDLVAHFKQKGLSDDEANLAAMTRAVDESIGKVRAALKANNMDKNTIIMFLSDQGGMLDNSPLRGGKKVDTLFEGGARVPFIVSWPGVTQSGVVNDSIVQSTDLFPTLVEISGGDVNDYKNLDGISLLNTIVKNQKLERGSPIFGYRAYEDLYASVREGDWKLLAYRSGKLELFNIASDPSESNEMATQKPDIVEDLKQKLVDWEVDVSMQQYSGLQ